MMKFLLLFVLFGSVVISAKAERLPESDPRLQEVRQKGVRSFLFGNYLLQLNGQSISLPGKVNVVLASPRYTYWNGAVFQRMDRTVPVETYLTRIKANIAQTESQISALQLRFDALKQSLAAKLGQTKVDVHVGEYSGWEGLRRTQNLLLDMNIIGSLNAQLRQVNEQYLNISQYRDRQIEYFNQLTNMITEFDKQMSSYQSNSSSNLDHKQEAQQVYMRARRGDTNAAISLWEFYREGHGVKQDQNRAMEWLVWAAEKNSAKAQYLLGKSYEEGEGVPIDIAEAKYWYEKSAKNGYGLAKQALRRMTRNNP